MKQRIKELGAYCVEHDISLDDLKQIRKELRTEKLKNESLNNEHFKRFLSLKNTLSSTKKLMQRIKNDVFNFDRA